MKTYIIAEAGVNHNGSMGRALEMIEAASQAGADAIKFQTFRAENLVTADAPKAPYQMKTTGVDESQYSMLKRFELTEKAHFALMEHARKVKIDFLSTPFDSESVDFLIEQCALTQLKVSSGDITNAPLLLKIARTNTPVILSTGMSFLREIESALGVLAFGYLNMEETPCNDMFLRAYSSDRGQAELKKNVVLLHCCSEYPAPFDEVNLRCMDTMRQSFQLNVGYSDHTNGIAISLAAVARGASIIEKHFTLNRSLPGPDHQASLEPAEFRTMVNGIRQIEQALGSARKYPEKRETQNRLIARKSLIARIKISKDEVFTEENLAVKRPGNGIDPVYYWDWLGKKAKRVYEANEFIK